MNLFENLQLMKESDTSIISEFKEFLASKNARYIANEIGETKDGMQIVIYDGDWKHEHLYMKQLLDEFFTNKDINISITSEEIGESDQDTFSARYNITFNAEPKEYEADIKPLKSTTENVDSSNWKQRFKGMDVYISDKHPDYQIKKFYTSSKQEVWQVLNFKTQREVFASGTFEGAIKWVEDKDVSKSEALDNLEESNNSDWKYIEETATKDDVFGDIIEGAHYIKQYSDNMIGYIYPPSEIEKLYRAKLVNKNHVKSLGYNAFIELDSAKEFLDETARKLTPVTYDEIMTQLTKINTHPHLKMYIDQSSSGAATVSIEGTLINGDPITFYDSSYIRTQRDVDFIKEQYAKASKEIDHMHKRGYLGVKDESTKVEESNHNEILDKDYATGDEMYNELVKYLNSLDQIGMDGEDCNWEPSEFNAKNLNADGEIYLVCGAYILIYPYINEWADEHFKVLVADASELSSQLKAGIEKVFNKYKTDKWQLEFEG